MRSSNPVFNRNEQFNENRGSYGAPQQGYGQQGHAPQGYGYGQPQSHSDLEAMYAGSSAGPAQTGRMTLDDVIMRTAMTFAVLLVGAAVGWNFLGGGAIYIGLAIGAFVLALVIMFKQITNPAAILGYAAAQGMVVGAVSRSYESAWPGIVSQAVLGTLAAFAAMLIAYKSGWIRATPKFTKYVVIAGIGLVLVNLANFAAGAFFKMNEGFGFKVGALGLVLSAAGVLVGSLFLILDFDFIERGIRQGVPQRYAWLAAFGLVVTLVWIYMEFLRLLSILRGGD